MSPIGVAKYILTAAVLVLSMFFGLRLLFAHDMRREAWRSVVKRYVYLSRNRFKSVTILLGWLFLFLALYVAFMQIDKLVTGDE
jgi:4-amino-4-deoxy-L-arabinose transferase-like glycosyltransferase